MTRVPSRGWRARCQGVFGLAADRFICCAWVAKSSANILLRADSYGPPSLIASAIPVSASVTEVLVITTSPADAGQHRLARGVEVIDDLDAETVLFQGDDGRCSACSSGSVVKLAGLRSCSSGGLPR